jgi:Protein of unknown function (DUF1588)/Protein of unknown function (DUF1592)/Protein of unknown function (DUF1595)/Protein of unknown function (DUF1587)
VRSLGRTAGWIALCGVAAAGCTGSISGLPNDRTGTGNTSGGNTGGAGGTPTLTVACQTPALGSPILRLLTRGEMVNTLNDIFPSVAGKWTSTLPAATVSSFGFDNDASSAVGSQFAQLMLDTATSLATAVTGPALSNILPCSTSSPNHACAETFLNQYGKRLFRRPLSSAEHDRYLTFFDASLAKSNFTSALKWMLIGLVQSPFAIYRSEVGTVAGDHSRHLTPYEQATALAYTFGGTTPSADLLAQADSGDLGDLHAVARNLQATDAGKQAFMRFFQAYLAYTSVTSMQKPNITAQNNVPGFNDVAADMIKETESFITDVVINKGGGLKELLTAPTTNPSAKLAAYYGFPAPPADFASLMRPAGRGYGILAQGAFLATHASSDSSSPTKRGLFPFYRLFCQPTRMPPANVPQIGQPMPGVMTTRQRYEVAHAPASSTCGSQCHRLWDPIGFGFEHFDEGGRFRDTEFGLPINSAASVPDPTNPDNALFSFSGEEDLVTGLANLPLANQCVAAYLSTFAFGTNEACIGSGQVANLQAGTVGLAEAFVQLASEPHFTRRNTN